MLGQRAEFLRSHRRHVQWDEVRVQSQRWGTADLEVQVGRALTHHALQCGFQIKARARRRRSDGDWSGTGDHRHVIASQPVGSRRKSTWPYSTAFASVTFTSRTTPSNSDSSSFMIFIASMMHTI